MNQETPPRVWGRSADHLHRREYARNTPTGVGKIICYFDRGDVGWKHPHGCGEDLLRIYDKWAEAETPPRVWGRFKS